ncbi:hypothetical protein ZWY2020_028697 [Hordeum vulgare]|nr:hypothetical protein ZWY2020_028697 [Hordeum vulgare]
MARKRRRADQRTTAPSPPPPFWTKLTHRQPVVVFAHGVELTIGSSSWKEMVKDALDAIEVVTFDYPYMSGGKRRPPPKADKLVDHHLSVVKNVVAEHPGHPLVLMRKVSCMVASSDGISASAVICLGYPLKGAKGVMRDEILLKLMVPTMFVQASRVRVISSPAPQKHEDWAIAMVDFPDMDVNSEITLCVGSNEISPPGFEGGMEAPPMEGNEVLNLLGQAQVNLNGLPDLNLMLGPIQAHQPLQDQK